MWTASSSPTAASAAPPAPESDSIAFAERDNAATPQDDVLNSTISEPGDGAARVPAYANTLGYDSDVFDLFATVDARR